MRLSELVRALANPEARIEGDGDPEITSISYRSRDVQPGALFVALPGLRTDGHDFIDEALKRGAAALAVQRPPGRPAVTVTVDDTRRSMSRLAACLYGYPSRSLTLVGVTGTNGKTTVTYLIESILHRAGYRPGVVGTVNYRFEGRQEPAVRTTPESPDLQRWLAQMRDRGATHAVLEIASHGIDQDRVADAWLDVGVFTNLSRDHLDYHGDMVAYWDCKQRLFTQVMTRGPKAAQGRAVINRSDAHGRELYERLERSGWNGRLISTGHEADNRVRLISASQDSEGIRAQISTPAGPLSVNSVLIGGHNLDNLLSAAGAAVALGIDPESIRGGIEALQCVPGRLERVRPDAGRYVYVDYAHTPDALDTVLKMLRSLATGRLLCVFGCGGDRDRGKRPQMGRIAARRCDLAVVTSDNPRTEDPVEIIRQICAGIDPERPGFALLDGDTLRRAPSVGRGYTIEPDRRRAIRLAAQASIAGDTLLIAGKGHEAYQTFGDQSVPFDDVAEARTALEALT